MQSFLGLLALLTVIGSAILGGMDLPFYWIAIPAVISAVVYPFMNTDAATADMQRSKSGSIIFYLFTQSIMMTILYWVGWLVGYLFR